MTKVIDDSAVIYSHVVDGVTVESHYSYAELKDGVYLSLGTGSTLEAVKGKLESWGYSSVNVWVESEVEFYKRKLNFGKVAETTKEAFHEALNCLPPLRYVNSSYMEAFMMSEETAAGYFTFYVRLEQRYFCVLEHFKKSYTDIEASIKEQILELVA